MASGSGRTANILPWLLVLASLSLMAFHFSRAVPLTEFHPDENIWIVESKYYKLLVLDGLPLSGFLNDPNGYEWVQSTFFDTACVVKSIFIRVSGVFGRDMGAIAVPRWDFGRDFPYNIDSGRVPPLEMLHFYRTISSVFALAACAIVLCIGAETSNIYGGTAAALFMAYNPLMVSCGTRAMAEGILMFFIVLSAYAALVFAKYLDADRPGQALASAAVAGVASGLAMGAKINGGAVLVLFFVLCAALFAARLAVLVKAGESRPAPLLKDGHLRVVVAAAVTAAVVSVVVFVSVDPVLRIAPLENSLLLLSRRMETARMQAAIFHVGLNSVPQRISYIWKTVLAADPALLLLYAAGTALMLRDESRRLANHGRSSARLLTLLWLGVAFAVLLPTLLLGWDRYVLPLVPPLSLMAGYPFSRLSRQPT